MSKTFQIILLIVLAILILANLGLLAFLLFQINKSKKKEESPKDYISGCSPTNFNTDFFKKSVEHAEKVLYADNSIKNGEQINFGTPLFDMISTLNESTKKSITIAIKSMTIEPINARNLERQFRTSADQEKVPLWFIVLREAVKKVIPSFMQFDKFEIKKEETPESNIIPIQKYAAA